MCVQNTQILSFEDTFVFIVLAQIHLAKIEKNEFLLHLHIVVKVAFDLSIFAGQRGEEKI
jgi:hypothetical protein